MLNRRLLIIRRIIALAAIATAPATYGDNGQIVTAAGDGAPVLELYRSDDGQFRYQLNNDWLRGMSLGVSPVDLADDRRRSRPMDKWRPDFDVYDFSDRSREITDLARERPQTIRWFWTIGSTRDFYSDDPFDFSWDLLQHFSLETKAGFLMPFGNRWLFGGAITLDRTIDDHSSAALPRKSDSKTAAGAYVGFKLAY
jgi:hypothetical protein